MMTFDPSRTYQRNPREAAKAFHIAPKQHNTFIVRFHVNGAQTGANQQSLSDLTFAAKMTDRPKVMLKSEEMHQYNKKRQIYTGFKLEQVRMQFYDSAVHSLNLMWQGYTKYYFGDLYFNNGVGPGITPDGTRSYAYDVTPAPAPPGASSGTPAGTQFNDVTNQGFGFTGANNNATDADAQFYFDKIEIYHFYNNGYYDAYQLIHPRITQYEPDDLDYENPAASLISMNVVYENLQYFLQRSVKGDTNNAPFDEFATGATFDGNVLQTLPTPQTAPSPPTQGVANSTATSAAQILSGAQGQISTATNYRYTGSSSSGALGSFGNFTFGPSGVQNLAGMATNNAPLAAALNLGALTNPLAVAQALPGVVNRAVQSGISGAVYDAMMGQANAVTSGFGTAAATLTNGLIASAAISGGGSIVTPSGVVLNPQSYGAINVQQAGTAQYGYNVGAVDSGTFD
jgi:hypothetical protein